MRYLLLLMLLSPTIVSANYSEIPNRFGGYVYYNYDKVYMITEHTAILNGEFGLFNNEGEVIWLTTLKKTNQKD